MKRLSLTVTPGILLAILLAILLGAAEAQAGDLLAMVTGVVHPSSTVRSKIKSLLPKLHADQAGGSKVTPGKIYEIGQVVPIYQELITKNRIFKVENTVFDSVIAGGVYEVPHIITPIPFKGGTGSPARPLAIQ